MRGLAAAWTLPAALLGACTATPAADLCPDGLLGEGGAPDFEMLVVKSDYSVQPLSDGDTVPMMLPPQGGRVVFVGVRATNVCAAGLQLTGALRDLTTQQVRVDSRTTNLVPQPDGWGASAPVGSTVSTQIADFANVPVCPNQWASTDLYRHVFGLEVTIQDKTGRTLTKKIQVTPLCGEPANAAQCMCICMSGYMLGQTCGDAGTDAAVDSGADGGPG